jgi:Tfp pilus assembly protein PilX
MRTFCEAKQKAAMLVIAARALRSERGVSLVVVIMLMVIILAITGAGLLFSSVELRVSGNYRVGTQAFYAADTGASFAFARIVLDQDISKALIPKTEVSPGSGLFYCSGSIAYYTALNIAPCTSGQEPLLAVSSINSPGYSLGAGTGYNASGFSFYLYQIDVTGVGPLGATRQVQALAQYGPK